MGHLHALRLRARRDPRRHRDARRVDRVPRPARDRRDVEAGLSRAGREPARGDRGRGGLVLKFSALVFPVIVLGTVMMFAGPGGATSWPPALAPLTDEVLLEWDLSGPGCVGVVEVRRRAPESGPDGEYTEYLDVRPIRWFAGTCRTAKVRLFAPPYHPFGFLSTGRW